MNPLRLLQLEWSKFFPSGTFRVFVGLYSGSFALVVFLARSVGRNMTFESNGTTSHPLAGILTYPNNWQLLAASPFKLLTLTAAVSPISPGASWIKGAQARRAPS